MVTWVTEIEDLPFRFEPRKPRIEYIENIEMLTMYQLALIWRSPVFIITFRYDTNEGLCEKYT